MLAGAVIILGIDHSVRLPNRWLARERTGFSAVLWLTVCAVQKRR